MLAVPAQTAAKYEIVSLEDNGFAINNARQIAGPRPSIWQNGVTTSLPVPGFGAYTLSINDAGLIAGTSAPFEFDFFIRHAFIINSDGSRYLQLPMLNYASSQARGVNNNGLVVGRLYSSNAFPRVYGKSFIWDATDGLRTLAPPTSLESEATAVLALSA